VSTRKFDLICLGRAAVDLYGQQLGGRATHYAAQLPGEVHGVLNPGGDALPPGGAVNVGRVARDEYPPGAEPVHHPAVDLKF
jgi:hypothetical protein